jgi:hypothetical protein
MTTQEETINKVRQHIRTLNGAVRLSKRDNGERYYDSELAFDHPLHHVMSDAAFSICEGVGQLDFFYMVLPEVVDQLATIEFEDESGAHEAIELEADCYTADLTDWLHSSVYNLDYLTQVLSEIGSHDAFEALALAQQRAKEEIAHAFVDKLFEYAAHEVAV